MVAVSYGDYVKNLGLKINSLLGWTEQVNKAWRRVLAFTY